MQQLNRPIRQMFEPNIYNQQLHSNNRDPNPQDDVNVDEDATNREIMRLMNYDQLNMETQYSYFERANFDLVTRQFTKVILILHIALIVVSVTILIMEFLTAYTSVNGLVYASIGVLKAIA